MLFCCSCLPPLSSASPRFVMTVSSPLPSRALCLSPLSTSCLQPLSPCSDVLRCGEDPCVIRTSGLTRASHGVSSSTAAAGRRRGILAAASKPFRHSRRGRLLTSTTSACCACLACLKLSRGRIRGALAATPCRGQRRCSVGRSGLQCHRSLLCCAPQVLPPHGRADVHAAVVSIATFNTMTMRRHGAMRQMLTRR